MYYLLFAAGIVYFYLGFRFLVNLYEVLDVHLNVPQKLTTVIAILLQNLVLALALVVGLFFLTLARGVDYTALRTIIGFAFLAAFNGMLEAYNKVK